MKYFHTSLALLIRYRSLAIFSFRSYYLLFTLHYQATLLALSPAARIPRLSLALAPLSIGFFVVRLLQQCLRILPSELLHVHSPLLVESQLVSSPALTDMLKFRACSTAIKQYIRKDNSFRTLMRSSSLPESIDPIPRVLVLLFYKQCSTTHILCLNTLVFVVIECSIIVIFIKIKKYLFVMIQRLVLQSLPCYDFYYV